MGQAFAFASGLFPLGVQWRRTSADPHRSRADEKRKRQDKHTNENEERGCAKGGLRRNEEEPELGRGFLPLPKQEPPRAPDRRGGSARIRRHRRI
ncbi:MAG: hypothetical protein A3B99_05485 [Candidatus Yanofskybacteria bacterium RIFCSPHIGHO2_02_FULL_44_12b]|nr:MAG: hypothetical protein A3B99_05485 [Candidatus Yanofskybacteria bacterium RIFCSPHIGHO2_02_FULL_44_12b]